MKESELPQLWATLRSSLFTPKTPVHVQKQLVELFAQDSRVIYLPTGAIYRGQHEITSLLKTVASGMASVVSNVVDGEKYALELMSSVSGFDKVQRGYSTKEMCVATLVHDNEIAWLLPDVQPTNKRIVVPLVVETLYNEEMEIAQIVVVWDQASVMKQITLLPTSLFCKGNSSETTLPVVGGKIADPLRLTVKHFEPPIVKPEPAGKPAEKPVTPETARRRGNIDFDPVSTPDLVRPSTRVFHKPGGPTHDIFGQSDAKVIKTCVPIDPRRYETHMDLTGSPVQTGPVKVLPELVSRMVSFGIADDEKPHSQRKHLPDPAIARVKEEGEEQQFRAGRKMVPGKEMEEHEQVVSHSGVRMVGSATYNQSHFSIGYEGAQDEVPGSYKRKQQQRQLYTAEESPLAKPRSTDSASNGDGLHRNNRPSSRVLGPPGGKSSWSLA